MRCYSVRVKNRQPPVAARPPALWLVSDARNDAVLERAIAGLPRGSGLIFRHYHLSPAARRARFDVLKHKARKLGHVVVLAADARTARLWGADGIYGAPDRMRRAPGLLRLATVHTLREIAAAHSVDADAVLLSPVFTTASHPGAVFLGPVRWRLLAARARVPVIALGGMTAHRARAHRIARWAAIDGLSTQSSG